MASTITVRNLDDDVKARLRVRAAENGRSMEAEVRAILRASVIDDIGPPERMGSWIHALFAGLGGSELELPSRDEPARGPDFSE